MVSRNTPITTMLTQPALQHKAKVISPCEHILRLPALEELGDETQDLKGIEPEANVGEIQSLELYS